MRLHDAIVVGCGPMGSATARHLAEAGRQVLLIGPTEDPDPATARAFASHHDRARIVRQLGHDAHWTALNQRAHRGMEALAAHTGRAFRSTEGCVYTSLDPDDAHIARALAEAEATGLPAERLSPDALAARWPDLHVPCATALYEGSPSGTVDPRALVAAQVERLEQLGGRRLDDVAVRIEGQGPFHVHTPGGLHTAHQVVVATGAATHLNGLLPRPPAAEAETETIVLVETDPADEARLAHLPALLDEGTGPGWDGLYAIRPLRYPDGRTYLKLGCNLASDRPLHDLDAVRAWLAHGDSEPDLPQLLALATERYPTLNVRSARTHRCWISRTPSKRPTIEAVGDGLWVVAGGNGYGAMASDGIGQVAAERLLA